MQNIIGVKITGDAAGLQQSLQGAARDVSSFGKSAQDAGGAVESLANGLKTAFVGSSIAVGLIQLKNTLGEVTMAMVGAQIQADKLRNGLNFAVGRANAGAEMEFIKGSAQKLGLEFVTTASQFAKLAAAARGTALEGQNIRNVFTAVSEASTVMGMSAEQTALTMNAVQQSISKGKVMAEELRGQLGEHLPGAFQIAARAMGVTTAELDKMLVAGQVLSQDFWPKFAAQLRNEVAPEVEAASKSMQASVNRLSTSWMEFKQIIASSGVGDAAASGMARMSASMAGISENMRDARASGSVFFGEFVQLAGGALGAMLPLVEGPRTLAYRLAEANKEAAELQKRWEQNPKNIYLYESIKSVEEYKQRLAEAIAQQNKLTGAAYVSGDDRTTQRAAVAERERQEAAANRQNALKAAMTTYATDTEQFNAEVAKQKQLLGDLYTPELEARIRKHFIKPIKDSANAFADVQDAAKSWAKYWQDFKKIGADAEASVEGLTKGQQKLLEYLQSPAYENMGEGARQLALQEAYAAIATEQLQASLKELTKERDKELATLNSSAQAQANQLQRLQDEEKAVSIAAEKNLTLAQAIELVAIARLQEAQAIQMSYGDESAASALQREIDARREMIALIGSKDARAAAKKAADDQAKEFKRASGEINRAITDSLFKAFESGEGFAKTFSTALQQEFKQMVLRPTVSAVMNPISQGVNSMIGGFSGSAAGGAGGSGLLGAVGNFTIAGSSISAIAGAVSTGVQAGWAGTSTAAAIEAYTAKGMTGTATGLSVGTSIGASAAAIQATLAAIPGWGWAAMAVLAATQMKGEYVKSTGYADANFAAGSATGSQNAWIDRHGGYNPMDMFVSPEATAFVNSMQQGYLNAAKTLGIGAAATTFGYSGNNADGGLSVVVGGTQGGGLYQSGEIKSTDTAGLALASSRAIFAALQSSELPAYLANVFNNVTVSTASQQTLDSAIGFATTLKTVRDALTETRTPLQILQETVASGFATLGTSAATFKTDFVAAIDAGITPENLANWQALGINIDNLAAVSGTASTAVGEVVRSLQDIANERTSLQDQLDNLTMTPEQLVDKQRGKIDSSNLGLFEQVQAAKDSKEANDALTQSLQDAADAAAALAETNQGWQDQLDILTDKETERSIALRDAGDDSTKSLMNQVWAQQDLKAATEEAARAAQVLADKFAGAMGGLATAAATLQVQLLASQGDAAGAAKLSRSNDLATLTAGMTPEQAAALTAQYDSNAAIAATIAANNAATAAAAASAQAYQQAMEQAAQAALQKAQAIAAERQGLQDQLDQLTMTSTQLLQKQRDALGESNRALFDQVTAAQAAKTANAEAARIAEAAAAAAKQLAATNQGWQNQLDVLTGKETDRSIALRDAGDDSTRALMQQVYAQQDLAKATADAAQAAKDAAEAESAAAQARRQSLLDYGSSILASAQSAASDAMAALQRAVAAEKNTVNAAYKTASDGVNASLKTVGDSIAKLQSLSSKLKSTLDGMRIAGSESAYRAEAQAQITAALATARATGMLPTSGSLDAALQTVSRPSEQLFSTFQEYAADFYRTANDISALGDLTGKQLSADEVTQTLLQDQLDALTKTRDESLLRLDATLEYAQLQLDAANGINASVMSVKDAMTALMSSLGVLTAARANDPTTQITAAYTNALGRAPDAAGLAWWQNQAAAGESIGSITNAIATSQEAQIRTLYKSNLGREADALGMDYWIGRLNTGATAAQITEEMKLSDEYKKLHGLAIGTNWIPQDMPAMLHAGEAVIPAAFNPERYSRASGTDALVAEIKALREDNARLQRAMESVAINTNKTAQMQKKWDIDGLPATTTAS